MSIYLINLYYFVIAAPILLVFFLILRKLYEDNNNLAIIISLTILLFLIRLLLVFFGETIGVMPYLVEDYLFYSILLVFGLIFTWFYLTKIEKKTLKDVGYEIENIKKSVLFGLLGLIPLICMMPLMILLTDIVVPIPPRISIEKLICAISFTLLGAFYEEIMFRGIIQNRVSDLVDNDEKKVIVITALIFAATHIFYLPFTGFGIYYIFLFVMALILSWLRVKYDQVACAILHGGIVFLLIILV